MWIEPEEMSSWAYQYCRNTKDNLEIRSLITKSKWIYCYCLVVKNRLEIIKYITVFSNKCKYFLFFLQNLVYELTGIVYVLYLKVLIKFILLN